MDRIEVLNWQDVLQMSNESVAYRRKIAEMLEQFETMWEGHFESFEAVQHQI